MKKNISVLFWVTVKYAGDKKEREVPFDTITGARAFVKKTFPMWIVSKKINAKDIDSVETYKIKAVKKPPVEMVPHPISIYINQFEYCFK